MNRRQLLTGMTMLVGAGAARADAPGPPLHPLLEVGLSDDARFAVTVDEIGTIRVWRTESGEMPYALPPSSRASAQLSPDGRYLATSLPNREEAQVAIRETATGKVLWEERASGRTEFQFAPDGKSLLMVTALPTRRLSFAVSMVEVPGGRRLWLLGRIWDRIELALAPAPDSSTVALEAREEGKAVVQVRDLRLGTVRTRMPVEGWVGGLVFSRDGKTLAVAMGGGQVELRDATSGRLQCRLAEVPLAKVAQVPEVRFSPDGKWLATAPVRQSQVERAGALRLWDTGTGAPGPVLPEAAGMLYPIFSPDSSLLAAIQMNGVARLWDVRSGALLRTLGVPENAEKVGERAVGQLRFTPEGAHLVAVTAIGIRRWETRTGKQSEFFSFR